MSLMDKAIQDYYDVRTSCATDLTVEQVRALNQMERKYSPHGEFVVEIKRDYTGKPVQVTAEFTMFTYEREYGFDGEGFFYVVVDPDGTVRFAA